MPSRVPAARTDLLPDGYPQFLAQIKARIHAGRTRAVLAANSALIELYWEIGHEIVLRSAQEGWGSKVIDRLAADLRREFPDMTGLSRRNLLYMRALAEAWPDTEEGSRPIAQRVVAQLPWGHNISLLTKLHDPEDRLWYAQQAITHAWSRSVLEAQIATDLRGRQGGALTTFEHAVPAPDSELVRDAIKDPYHFEFLSLGPAAKERDLELALLNDIESFLMEMGQGFALVGRQTQLRVPDHETGQEQEFYLDLLFYNYILRRFIVIDLKIEDFKPEFAGKMNFYLNALDTLHEHEGHEPSIGLILCPGRNKTITEWALRGIDKPVAVARYTTGDTALTHTAPAELKPALPDLPQLANELTTKVETAEAIYTNALDAKAADDEPAG
jgi:predicted nuclease of restriction endonuclease-like (RecB) superfamily